jgi:hypothetical protein
VSPLIGAVTVALVLVTPRVYAQWEKVPHPSVPRTSAGEAILTAPAPKARARKPDLTGVWLADGEPLPPEAGPTVEAGGLEFSRYMINVAADIPPDEVPIQPWAAELFQQRLQSSGKDDPVAHCKPTGLPLLNVGPIPFKIVQMPDLVLMLYEENNVFRQIFLDGRKPVEDPVPQALGYSTGRWEGRELVVDTIGFSDRHWLDAMGHPLTEQLHLTERFRRPDAGHLEIETTIDDPGAYTKPFTYTVKLTLQPDEDLLEYFCTDNEKDAQHYQ